MRKTKKAIHINRHRKPVEKVAPPSEVEDRAALIGSMKDKMKILGDIISPASDTNEWEVIRDPDRVLNPRPRRRKQ